MRFFHKTALIDLDDTLVHCHRYYLDARARGFQVIADATGMAFPVVERLFNAVERAQKDTHVNAFSRERFPNSFAVTAHAAHYITGRMGADMTAVAARTVGESVFDAEYALKPHANEFLARVRALGYRMVLVTQGDPLVQTAKLRRHPTVFAGRFDAEYIVPRKTVEVYRDIISRESVDPETSIMIGDSMEYDMKPAQAAGLGTIWVNTGYPLDHWSDSLIPDAEVRDLLGVITRLEQLATVA